MADRIAYGNRVSENGWPMVDTGSCVWVRVPGAEHVSLRIREGQPAKILGAWAADWNAYVEPLRDRDSACWTETNSVPTSNHLSGTACDLNWESHPFRVLNAGLNGTQVATVREMIDFYERMVFWGNDWESPKDAMHSQMGYDTYGAENFDRVEDFIRHKIRADGFSTFRRGSSLPPKSDQSDVALLRRAMEPTGISDATLTGYLPHFQEAMRAAEITNVPRAAAWCSQLGHESAGLKYMAEIQTSDPSWSADRTRYRGRGPIQLTWSSNYRKFGQWCVAQGYITDPEMFVNQPELVEQPRWGFLAASWYWLNAGPRPGRINQYADDGDILAVSRCINGWIEGRNPIGWEDRRSRYSNALALGDQLLALTGGDDDMAAVPQDQWDRVFRELTQRHRSRSPLRHLGEGEIDTWAGVDLNDDANDHVTSAILKGLVGDTETLDLLGEVAGADPTQYPDRQADAVLAQRILAYIEATNPAALTSYLKGQS